MWRHVSAVCWARGTVCGCIVGTKIRGSRTFGYASRRGIHVSVMCLHTSFMDHEVKFNLMNIPNYADRLAAAMMSF